MPELPNRDTVEARVAKRIAGILQRQLGQVMEELGDPPDITRLTPEFWAKIEAQTIEVIRPELEAVFLDSAEQLLNAQPIGVEWGLVNQRAVDWAADYTRLLYAGLGETTSNLVSSKVAQFFKEEGMTLRDLRRELQQAFGARRAELIAITETTRAAVEGERAFVQELRAEGVQMVPRWVTERDESVCPICEPRDGQLITDETFPPIHARCRCSVTWEFPENATG